LQGKVYTITGAAGGIGAATAIQLAKSGAKALSLSDMNTIELDRIAGLCRSNL
jgi:NAD(P)-dependent dehydrogenase (short-subunit alcohol dehydrogenase family)